MRPRSRWPSASSAETVLARSWAARRRSGRVRGAVARGVYHRTLRDRADRRGRWPAPLRVGSSREAIPYGPRGGPREARVDKGADHYSRIIIMTKYLLVSGDFVRDRRDGPGQLRAWRSHLAAAGATRSISSPTGRGPTSCEHPNVRDCTGCDSRWGLVPARPSGAGRRAGRCLEARRIGGAGGASRGQRRQLPLGRRQLAPSPERARCAECVGGAGVPAPSPARLLALLPRGPRAPCETARTIVTTCEPEHQPRPARVAWGFLVRAGARARRLLRDRSRGLPPRGRRRARGAPRALRLAHRPPAVRVRRRPGRSPQGVRHPVRGVADPLPRPRLGCRPGGRRGRRRAPRLEATREAAGIDGRIDFLGFRRDVPDIFRACDAASCLRRATRLTAWA